MVADTWWHAKTALDALPIVWDEGDNAKVSSASIAKWLEEGLDPAQPAFIGNENGDAKAAIASAARKIEAVYNYPYQNHATMEPLNATALYTAAGQLTIWCSTQGAFGVRDQVAELLNIPVSMIRVIPMEIGGGFGGKVGVYLEPVAALLSKKSGHRPVKMTMSYADVLAGTGPTSGSYIRVKMGANRKGQITAAEAYLAYEAGAYPGSPIWGGMSVIFAPYRIENLLIDAYDVVVNKPRTSAYRAPGGSNAAVS